MVIVWTFACAINHEIRTLRAIEASSLSRAINKVPNSVRKGIKDQVWYFTNKAAPGLNFHLAAKTSDKLLQKFVRKGLKVCKNIKHRHCEQFFFSRTRITGTRGDRQTFFSTFWNPSRIGLALSYTAK